MDANRRNNISLEKILYKSYSVRVFYEDTVKYHLTLADF